MASSISSSMSSSDDKPPTVAAQQQQAPSRRPAYANWFFSLRRQPRIKPKKSIVETAENASTSAPSGAPLQRSCIDLSYANNGAEKPQTLFDSEAVSSSSYMELVAASTDNIFEEEISNSTRRRVRTMTQLCGQCCCASKSGALGHHDAAAIKEHSTKYETLEESCDVLKHYEHAHTNIKSRPDFEINNEGKVVTVLNKKSDFLRTKTVTTTRTLIITRPVEVMLNERGEIVKRCRHVPNVGSSSGNDVDGGDGNLRFSQGRSNSLDCVLDTSDEGRTTGAVSPTNVINLDVLRPGVLASCDDLQYIDDNNIMENNNNEKNLYGLNNNDNDIYSNVNNQNKSACDKLESPATNQSLKSPTSPNQYSNHHQRPPPYSHYNNYNNNNNNNNNINKNINKLGNQQHENYEFEHDAVIMRNHNKQINDELCEVVSEMETLNVPEDCKHSNKDKQMSIGRKKFNMDPKKGIEYLVENRLLRHDPQDVAHFLYKGEGLNKTAIGDYLGEKNDFNECVLKAFVALHDFTNLILVQALRQFLWSFRLPGEAQKIDRMMECFAQRYCQLNPDIFTNTDTCYVLSFAIIMLNTSLHNPSVKDKPTVEQFISMNRGINNGGDLPRGLLESLYESIRTEPFKIPQDDGNDLMHTFFNPDKEGWLWKQGGRYKSWKRRWFILNDNCLYYFEYTTDKEPRGIIPLENISVREIHDRSKPHCFELFATGGADIIKACKTDSEGKVVEGKHTVYRMSAATEEDQQEWIGRLKQSISHNPFYDILVQRKKKALSKS